VNTDEKESEATDKKTQENNRTNYFTKGLYNAKNL
jgi:hypothetical protein